LHKEAILRPAPQYITVRYRKGVRLSCPTREKLEHGPPEKKKFKKTDDEDLKFGNSVSKTLMETLSPIKRHIQEDRRFREGLLDTRTRWK
jgi:hypothetical protein